jgi:hypothetical protein
MARGHRVLNLRIGQLRIAVCLHFRHFPQASCCRVRLVARGGLRGLRHRGIGGGGLLAAARLAARPLSCPAHHPALPDYLRVCVRVTVAADAPPVATLRDLPGSRHRGQRDRTPGILAGADHVVSGTPRRGFFYIAGRWRGRRHDSSSYRRSSDSRRGLAGFLRHSWRRGSRDRATLRFPRPRAFPPYPFRGNTRRRRLGERGIALSNLLDNRRRAVSALG